jgi:hypothetical protein
MKSRRRAIEGWVRERALACFAISATTLLAPAIGAAQSSRAIVLPFQGPASDAARSEVVSAIEAARGWEVADHSEVDRAATRLGSAAGSREVAGEIGASAIVSGRVVRRGRRLELRLEVRDPDSGATLGSERFSGRGGPGLRAAIRRSLWDDAGDAIERGNVPGIAPPARGAYASTRGEDADDERPPGMADDEEAPAAAAAGDASASGIAPSPLYLAIGATMFSRTLAYTDDLYGALRPYQLPIGWAGHALARWYPGAHFTQDFAANLGIEAAFTGAIAIRSRESDGTTYPTDSFEVRGGADVRIPLAPVELGVGLGFGMHTFTLGASEMGNVAGLPNVEYQFVRPAVRARIDIAAGLYAEGAFGWRVLTSAGGLSSWFPRNSGSGFDLGAWLGWESDAGVGVRAGFEMQRYFFAMNPEPGDTNVAGGAEDQFLTGTASFVWRMR